MPEGKACRSRDSSRLVVHLIDEVPRPPLVVLAHGAVLLATDHFDEIAAFGNDLPQVIFSSVVRSPLLLFSYCVEIVEIGIVFGQCTEPLSLVIFQGRTCITILPPYPKRLIRA